MTWRWRLFAISFLVGAMFAAGAIWVTPGLSACPHCAVLTQDFPGCHGEPVVGGWICGD